MVNTESYKKIKYKAKEPTAVIPLLKCINTFGGKILRHGGKKNNLLMKKRKVLDLLKSDLPFFFF